jgi:hypothetical protein
MFVYAIALKPVILAGGVEGLDENKKKVFEGMLYFMARLIECAQEVEEVKINEDYTIVVKSESDVHASLKRLGENAVITQLDPKLYKDANRA